MRVELIHQPDGDPRLGDVVTELLTDPNHAGSSLSAAVAFAKASGVRHLVEPLRQFLANGGTVRLAVGVDHRGTSAEGLRLLLDVVGAAGDIWIVHNEHPYVTFHPKLYLLEGETEATLILGSGNISEGGLFTNYEAAVIVGLDLRHEDDLKLARDARSLILSWMDEQTGFVRRLDLEFLQDLERLGYAVSEQEAVDDEEVRGAGWRVARDASEAERQDLFGRSPVRAPPRVPRSVGELERALSEEQVLTEPEEVGISGFVMTLHQTDVGTGQITPGAARRSPEIFIPLGARNAHPEFWGWPGLFDEDPARPGKFDRTGVRMRVGPVDVEVNMMTWPVKHDFRLRSEALRSAGSIGDVLRIEKADGSRGFDYYVEVVPMGTREHPRYANLCTNRAPNSEKRWGYY